MGPFNPIHVYPNLCAQRCYRKKEDTNSTNSDTTLLFIIGSSITFECFQKMMQFYFFNFGVTMSTAPDFFWGADSIMMLPYFNKSLEAEPSGAFFGRYKILINSFYIAIVAKHKI